MSKIEKYIIIFILILLIMIIPNIVKAGTTENGLTYEIQEDGVHITGCDNNVEGEIKIPSEIEGTIVSTIDDCSFVNCHKITSIYIPKTVTSIARGDFEPFVGKCSKLVEFKVDDENQYYSSKDGILFNKDKTHIVRYPEGKNESIYTLPDTIKVIEKRCFCFLF